MAKKAITPRQEVTAWVATVFALVVFAYFAAYGYFAVDLERQFVVGIAATESQPVVVNDVTYASQAAANYQLQREFVASAFPGSTKLPSQVVAFILCGASGAVGALMFAIQQAVMAGRKLVAQRIGPKVIMGFMLGALLPVLAILLPQLFTVAAVSYHRPESLGLVGLLAGAFQRAAWDSVKNAATVALRVDDGDSRHE